MGTARLDEPTTSQLLGNALMMVEQLTSHKLEDGVAKSERQAPKELVRLFDEKNPATEIRTAIKFMFNHVLRRAPASEELASFSALIQRNIQDAGRKVRHASSLAAVLLLPEAVLRSGRRARKTGRHGTSAAGSAQDRLRFGVTHQPVAVREPWLLADADGRGKLGTADGVRTALRKMLDDPKLEKPADHAVLFASISVYAKAVEACKGDRRRALSATNWSPTADQLDEIDFSRAGAATCSAILSTNKSFVNYRSDAKEQQGVRQSNNAVHLAYGPASRLEMDQQTADRLAGEPTGRSARAARVAGRVLEERRQRRDPPRYLGPRTAARRRDSQPSDHRRRELPIAPERTLRDRMAVTHEAYCWSCHQLINRTAYPFEIYDHFGRFRTRELVDDLEVSGQKHRPRGETVRTACRRRRARDHPGSFDFGRRGRVRRRRVGQRHRLRGPAGRVPFAEQVFVRRYAFALLVWAATETPGTPRRCKLPIGV
jgi:hypothetical protein